MARIIWQPILIFKPWEWKNEYPISFVSKAYFVKYALQSEQLGCHSKISSQNPYACMQCIKFWWPHIATGKETFNQYWVQKLSNRLQKSFSPWKWQNKLEKIPENHNNKFPQPDLRTEITKNRRVRHFQQIISKSRHPKYVKDYSEHGNRM